MGVVRIPGPRRPGGGVGRPSARWCYFGGTLQDVARLRAWCVREPELQNGRGFWVQLVASELATNAVLHTATGEKYGRMGASIEILRQNTVTLCVLDQGAKAGHPPTSPRLMDREDDDMSLGGRGLWLVDRIADYWWWEGQRGFPLAIRAIIRLDQDLALEDLGAHPTG